MTRRISIFFGILFFLLLGSSIILASEELTLEESIKIALEKSLSIYSAKEEIKAKVFLQGRFPH
jgi:prepilin signal peptidase PulO-like enzyme (type II secretory pathway)